MLGLRIIKIVIKNISLAIKHRVAVCTIAVNFFYEKLLGKHICKNNMLNLRLYYYKKEATVR